MDSTEDEIIDTSANINTSLNLNTRNLHKFKKLFSEYTPIVDYITQCCSILTDSAVLNEDLIGPEGASNSTEVTFFINVIIY